MKLEDTQDAVGAHMTEILTYFKPGRKITVLVRTDGEPEQDFLMTNDEPGKIIEAVQRRDAAAQEPSHG